MEWRMSWRQERAFGVLPVEFCGPAARSAAA
jgi:hypothetical protein